MLIKMNYEAFASFLLNTSKEILFEPVRFFWLKTNLKKKEKCFDWLIDLMARQLVWRLFYA